MNIFQSKKFLSLYTIKSSGKILLSIFLLLFLLINFEWILHYTNVQDFGSFYDSSLAFKNGLNPYSDKLPNIYTPLFEGNPIPSPNLNPPPFFLLSPVFLIADIYTSYRIWQTVSMFMFIISITIWFKINGKNKIPIWTILISLSFAGIWTTLKNGQIYFFLLLSLTFAIYFIKTDSSILAGFCIGLICALKPNFTIIILGFLITKRILLFSYSTFFTLLLYLIPLVFWGITPYHQWLEATQNFTGYAVTGNGSIIGLFSRAHMTEWGIFVSVLIMIAGLLLLRYIRINDIDLLTICVLLSLICSPITWTGYTVFLIPFFILSTWRIHHWISGILLTIPISVTFASANQSLISLYTIGWVYGFALIILFTGYIMQYLREIKQKSLILT
jgi:hypothetical protein